MGIKINAIGTIKFCCEDCSAATIDASEVRFSGWTLHGTTLDELWHPLLMICESVEEEGDEVILCRDCWWERVNGDSYMEWESEKWL
jgi:hypothetical protein